jgi:hypothetical protein
MWQLLIGSATELIGGHFKRKSEEKQAQHERKLETIKHEANWDNIQATNAGNSWKDEWFTVLFSVPLVMAFVPEVPVFPSVGGIGGGVVPTAEEYKAVTQLKK